MRGRELRAVGHRSGVHGRAQQFGELAGLGEGVARGELGAGDDDRCACREQHVGKPGERLVAGPGRTVDAHRAPQVQVGFGVQHVARQTDEHRPGRRRHRHLGGAPQDPRQVLDTRRLDRPLDQRLRDRHQRVVQQGLEQAVPLFLLPGRDDDRRVGELGVVQRPHRIAEPRRDVHVRRGQAAGRTGIAVGHAEHHGFLQAQHELQLRMVRQHLHDRQFGGAGVAEQVADALVGEDLQEGRAAGDSGHEGRPEGWEVSATGRARRRLRRCCRD